MGTPLQRTGGTRSTVFHEASTDMTSTHGTYRRLTRWYSRSNSAIGRTVSTKDLTKNTPDCHEWQDEHNERTTWTYGNSTCVCKTMTRRTRRALMTHRALHRHNNDATRNDKFTDPTDSRCKRYEATSNGSDDKSYGTYERFPRPQDEKTNRKKDEERTEGV